METIGSVTADDHRTVRLNAEGGHGQGAIRLRAVIGVIAHVTGVHIGEIQLHLRGSVLHAGRIGHQDGITLGQIDGAAANVGVVVAGVVVAEQENDVPE